MRVHETVTSAFLFNIVVGIHFAYLQCSVSVQLSGHHCRNWLKAGKIFSSTCSRERRSKLMYIPLTVMILLTVAYDLLKELTVLTVAVERGLKQTKYIFNTAHSKSLRRLRRNIWKQFAYGSLRTPRFFYGNLDYATPCLAYSSGVLISAHVYSMIFSWSSHKAPGDQGSCQLDR